LWIGDTELGLFIWDNGKLSSYRIHGRGGERPFMVFCDRRGYLWLGFADGTIGRIDQNDTFTSFARPGEGVGRPVTSIYQAADDSIWFVGTKGLTRFRDGTFAAVGKSNGLPAGPISGIVQDTDGYIWFGMTSGIARIDPNEPARAAASPSHRVRFRLYDIADGLAGMPRGFAAPGAVRAADGRLWFVTGSGVTVLDPASIGDAEVVPNPRIERVVVNDQQVYPAGRSPLPPGTTRIEIDYGVAQIASPLKVRFRYRLDGVDADWVDAGTRRIAFYTNLGPGNYRFTVISGTHDGAWRETGAEWMFAIQPAYYQTYWFYAACLALLLVSLSAMWQYRIRQIRRNFSLITAERMRLSRELHDTLLQSLVGVTLQLGVASHTLGVRPGSIGESLDRVRQNVERGIREARRRIVDLRWQGSEDVELPALLRGIKDRLGENGRKIEVVLHGKPGPTTLAVREQLTLIAQEAVHNALRHAEPQRIWITLQYDVDRVVLQISDDGRGFDPREVVSRDGSHYGLRIMEERAREIGGQLHVIASVSGGAEIKAVVPVRAGARPSASRKPGFGSIRSAWRGTFRRHQAAGSDGTRRVSAGR
jgi:signal transduction histidine kinase